MEAIDVLPSIHLCHTHQELVSTLRIKSTQVDPRDQPLCAQLADQGAGRFGRLQDEFIERRPCEDHPTARNTAQSLPCIGRPLQVKLGQTAQADFPECTQVNRRRQGT